MPGITGLDIASGVQQGVNVAAVDSSSNVAGVAASGTVTVADYTQVKVLTPAAGSIVFTGQPSDGDTVTINGIVFTFKTALSGQHHVLIGVDATTTAQNFKAVVNSFSSLCKVTASGASTTITLTENTGGAAGNSDTLTKSGANITANAFAGGLDADTLSVNGRAFTFVSGAPATSHQIQKGSSNNDQASKLATAIGAIPQETNVTASPSSAVVTLTAQSVGVPGNSIALATSNGSAFTLSGATLSGGVNPSQATSHYAMLVRNADGKNGAAAKRAFANVAASGTDTSLIALVAGKKLRVLALVVKDGATVTDLTFNSKGGGAGTAISPLFHGDITLPYNPDGWFETNAGEALTCTTGTGSTTGILVEYAEV